MFLIRVNLDDDSRTGRGYRGHTTGRAGIECRDIRRVEARSIPPAFWPPCAEVRRFQGRSIFGFELILSILKYSAQF
jgi:hypothetical protein